MKTKTLSILACAAAAFCTLCAGAYEVTVAHGKRTLRGVVTCSGQDAPCFFMHTDDGEWWRAGLARDVSAPLIGDVVEVGGEVLRQTVNNRIDHCSVKVVGHDESLIPGYENATPTQLNEHPASGSPGPDRFARRISVEGCVFDVNRRHSSVQLQISDGGGSISVSFAIPSSSPLPAGLETGAIVRAKGTYAYVTLPLHATQPVFTGITMPTLMLSSPADLEVLTAPPFWTPLRLSILGGGAIMVWLALVVWVAVLRRTVNRQVKVIERALRENAIADGVRRERLRLSHDLHDDFQQLLAGTMFQISAALNWLAENNADKVREQLEKATANLVHTQSQLRTVLWGLQEESEGPGRLIDLFRYVSGRMAHWEGVVSIASTGHEPALARTIAGGLLMILQESVGNAIKHGGARHVDVSVAFEKGRLVLVVKDDGSGFDVTAHSRGLGLVSMGDRARALGGTFSLTSELGKGTEVKVEVPV